MTDVVTDPDLLLSLEGPNGTSAAGELKPFIVDDPDLLAHLEGQVTKAVPADAAPGPNGLMWNASGGYDPKSGELVIGGKPFQAPSTGVGLTASTLNGVPIIGPALESGAEKVAALARNLTYGDPQDKAEAAIKGEVGDYQRDNPKATMAAKMGGAVLGTIPAAQTAIGARALGLVGGVPGRIIQGGIGGGAIGALDAAARGENVQTGAVAGSGLGLAAPVIGSAIGAVAKPVINAFAPPVVEGPLAGLSSTAKTMLSNAAQGETPATLDAAHAALGPEGFLGDLNHPLSRLTKSIADQPEQAAGDIRAAYAARSAADGDRINSAITDALGPELDLAALTRSDKNARSEASDPLYEQWRATQIPPTDELRALLPRLNAAGVADRASKKMAIEGAPGAMEWFKPAADGSLSLDLEKMPTAQTFDYMKRALQDKIGSAIKANEGDDARLYQKLKNDLVSAIDNHPDQNVAGVWKQARQAWSDPTSIITARDDGAAALRRGTDVNELREQFKSYSDPEKIAFLQGVRGYATHVFGSTKNGDTAIKNELLAPNAQKKLEYLIGSDKAKALTQSLNQEEALSAASKKIIGGPTTHENQQASVLSGPAAIPGAVANYVRNFALDRPGSWLGMTPGSMLSEVEAAEMAAARGQLSPLLTTRNGPHAELARALLDMTGQRASNDATARQIRNIATGLINGGGREPVRQIQQQYFSTPQR